MIERSKKIKDLSPLEKENGNQEVITYLLSLLGISVTAGDGKSLHYMAIDSYILENLGNLNYDEIREAFNMLLRGDFEGMEGMKGFKLFNKLDCIIFSKVIQCYQIQKKIELERYNNQIKRNLVMLEQRNNQISEKDKRKIVYNGILDCFETYKKVGNIEFGKHYVFDELNKLGLINRDATYRKAVYQVAIDSFKKPRSAKSGDLTFENAVDILVDFDNKLKNRNNKPSQTQIILKAQKIALSDYFNNLIDRNKNIEDQIKSHFIDVI